MKVIFSAAILCLIWPSVRPQDLSQDQPLSQDQVIAYVNQQLTPSGLYNQSCVSTGCPEATHLPCPEVSNASSVLPSLLVWNACAVRWMCGRVLDPSWLPALSLALATPNPYDNSPSCAVPEGSSGLEGLAQAQTLNWTQGPDQLRVSLRMPRLALQVRMACGNISSVYSNLLGLEYEVRARPTGLTLGPLAISSQALNITQGNSTLTQADFSPRQLQQVAQALAPAYQAFLEQIYQLFYRLALNNCPKRE